MAIAYLFPGQGAQFAGMGQELYNEYPEAREIFDQASQVLGYDAAAVCFDDPDGVINATEYTQPLLLSASMAAYVCWAKEHPHLTPAFVAGLSLGEYTALVAAGSLSFADAVKVARLRGRFMQEAVPNGVGTMAAIIGLEAARVEEICAGVCSPENWVEPANYNCPGQLVVSGHVGAVRAVCQAAKDAGAAKALPLPVSAPFHSRL
ncbi:MAG TPA: ACP S-malonyltransferase, partial [Symbiobacteriaceae bacterium]|nr:ACP S-malonyltransferase [Symbiobacteriaceae bacterium]